MTRWDWSSVLFVGVWTEEEARAFAVRVAEIADEEAARAVADDE